MAASPAATGADAMEQDKWAPSDHDPMGPAGDAAGNGAPPSSDDRMVQDTENPDYSRSANGGGATAAPATASEKAGSERREKQIKVLSPVALSLAWTACLHYALQPNKVYIGGLPEHTRREDLQSCFGKIGNIVNIELKYVMTFRHHDGEFDSKEAAEESVAKYNEGYFMGNKIRVEISHGGGKTQKYASDPGACFKCGQMGHWARECPNHTLSAGGRRDTGLIDRIQPPRDYLPLPPRDYPYRDDFGRYPPPPPRDPRYYDYPPIPPPGREYRRPPSPPREYRDYPGGAPPPRASRDADEYRSRGAPPAPSRYESRPGYYDDLAPPPGYPPRGVVGPPPPPREYYDRYDRRPPPASSDRYSSYPSASTARPRTPPGAPPPPRAREDYDRPPPAREYPAPASESRGRPVSPPPSRYSDYGRAGSTEAASRYRSSPVPDAAGYDSGYTSGAPRGFGGNGYAGGGGPPSPRGGSSRDYPRSRDPEPSSGYSRRP
ncbi:hypothetical protein NEOLEDRAFT_1157914 [Neolentinus lepideus HHB14362 ss-1]|uniref:RNA-binding domain-containing protein n=1 Tax=Neolentinus lepideus HHB14362 ss-1 TaxID=1314782 RepID=A0A165QA55_9AGAM|nr:hypothetical protein NEOLEDRAFT_1157914 [Neolentinus lepideus HHB14362 ss-1]